MAGDVIGASALYCARVCVCQEWAFDCRHRVKQGHGEVRLGINRLVSLAKYDDFWSDTL